MNTNELLVRLKDTTGTKHVSGRCTFCGDPGNFNKVRHGVCVECWQTMIEIIEDEIKGIEEANHV